MKFRPGDQVAFINEKQNGVVAKLLPGNMVVVAIEDGFEIPVRESELILLQKGKAEREEPETESAQTGALFLCEPGNACLAAVPSTAGAVLTGPVTWLLINRTGHELVYTFHIKTPSGWNGVQCGICQDQAVAEVLKKNRNEVNEIRSLYLQLLVFRKDAWTPQDIIRRELAVLLPDIRTIQKDVPDQFVYARSAELITVTSPEKPDLKNLVEKFSGNPVPGKTSHGKHRDSYKEPTRRGIVETEREVDLHIEELVPEMEGLSNSEMLRIQLRHFSEAMDAAIRDHLRRIVFIHGVGSGKLKNEIRKELAHYTGISFRDADASRYGRGATEVILVHF